MRGLWVTLALALAAIGAAFVVLEGARSGVAISQTQVGPTPVTVFETQANGPAVVIAHGFAGSRQMMQGYALSLARAGYRVLAFDFEGHGRHPVPMSGDVDAIEGTTRLLVEQTLEVVAAAQSDGPVALLGHSMATDILIRAAQTDEHDIGPLVVISAFSQVVDEGFPPSMLMITGAWEPGLRAFAREAVQMVEPSTGEGDLALSGAVSRKAVVAPLAEHVGVLHSRAGRAEAVAWLNAAYGRDVVPRVPATGPWTLVLLVALVILARPMSRLLPPHPDAQRPALAGWQVAALLVVPAAIAAPVAVLVDLQALPVLVADHLAVHLGLFGLIQLALLRAFGQPFGRMSATGLLAVLIWGLVLFGLALDRYAANFLPIPERMAIIAILALGAVPFMLADALVTDGGRASPARRILARVAFLASLALAVTLDFQGLFFLIMIAPVIVLFYALFGLVGRWVAQRQGALASGLGLGLCLAWALGVSFPMFAAG